MGKRSPVTAWSKQDQASYLARIAEAPTVEALEAVLQSGRGHPFFGPKWRAISAARVKRGDEICAAHPHGAYVPRFGARRRMTCCGENRSVGYGGNSTGERYAWHGAKTWAVSVMMRHGLGRRAAHRVWGCAGDYPHRALPIVEAALRGEMPDPELNVLQMPPYRTSLGRGVRYTLEANEASTYDRRASRMCLCGGVLFDWGSGYSEGFTSISWHCNACDRVFTEYVSSDRLAEIRQRSAHDGAPFHVGPSIICELTHG